MMIVRTWKSLPRLVRFMLRNAAIGIVAGWIFLGMLLWADVGGLYSLMAHSRFGHIALFLLMGGFAVTFGAAGVSSAVLLGHEFEEDNTPDNASKAPVTELEPALLKVPAKR